MSSRPVKPTANDIAHAHLASERAWDNATAQLRKLAQAHHGRPLASWIDAVVEWHMDAMFAYLEKNAAAGGAPDSRGDIAALRRDLLATVTLLRTYIEEPGRNTAAIRQRLSQLEAALRQDTMTAGRSRAS
jgi:hypothetical protein